MKKIIGSVCVLFIIGLVTFIEPSVVFAADEYDVYAKIESFTWKEFDGGSQLLKESGPIYGIGLSVKGDIFKSLTLKTRGELFMGSVDYDGQTQAGTPVETDTDYKGLKIEVDGGRKIIEKEESSFEPFVGLGVRRWTRDIQSTGSAIGYEETWKSLYARLGIRGDHTNPNKLIVFAEAAVKLPIYNENEIDGSAFGVGDVTA